MRFFYFILLLALAAPNAHAQLYDVRGGTVNFERKERDALKVQVKATECSELEKKTCWLPSKHLPPVSPVN
jgi:hypothetical protein